MTRIPTLLVIGLIALFPLIASTAEAKLIPEYDVELRIEPIALASSDDTNRTKVNYTFLVGEMAHEGSAPGVYGFADVRNGSVADAARIDVFKRPNILVAERTFTSADLLLARNSTFTFFSDAAAINHSVEAPVAIGMFLDPSKPFFKSTLITIEAGPSMVYSGSRVNARGEVQGPSTTLWGLLTDANSTATIQGAEGTASFQGPQYFFRIVGTPTFDIRASGILVPFQGNNTTLQVSSAPDEDVEEEFEPEAMNAILKKVGLKTIFPPKVADGLKSFAPILNGVFFGNANRPIVNGEDFESNNLTVLRFDSLLIEPSTRGAVMTGHTDFVLLEDEGFYTTTNGATIWFLKVPPLSLILWIIAAIAIALSFLLKPMLGGPQVGALGLVRILALAFHLLALAIAFLLWDAEIKSFLGTSLFTIFVQGGFGQGTILAITALFELVTFSVAGLLFGMPLRFVVNSALKLGGLKKARGVGKGVGNLATWGIGAPFIPFLLNGFVGFILDALQKAQGAG